MEKEENSITKKRRFNVLDIIVVICIITLLAVYVPRAVSLYLEGKENKKEDDDKKVIEYPLEVEVSSEDIELFSKLFKDYSVGTISDVDFADGVSEVEMVNFARHILSEKYSASGIISNSSMNNYIKQYFNVENLDYVALGFKQLKVYKEWETKKVYNLTKLMQQDEQAEMYLAYVDCISKENVTDGKYEQEDIDGKYIFALKKVNEEENIRYIIQKVNEDLQENNGEKESIKD